MTVDEFVPFRKCQQHSQPIREYCGFFFSVTTCSIKIQEKSLELKRAMAKI